MPRDTEYIAPQDVRDALRSMGRTEDVRFSPNAKRLAVACLNRNRIALFGIDIVATEAGARVELTSCMELSSPALHGPHGVDFIDDETLVVANREGDVTMFRLPSGGSGARSCELLPVQTWPAGRLNLLKTPGSITVVNRNRDRCEILICNNSGNTVTRHVLDSGGNHANSDVLLRKWLDIPDGVTASRDLQWIAVSNHNTHNVLLYESLPSLNEHSDPDGILRGVYYPHGLRFSRDGDYLFVADAGTPYVLVYARDVYDRDAAGWRGVRHPAAKVQIMDEALFRSGRSSARETGPKGLDIDPGSNILVATSEFSPLAFFDVSAIVKHAPGGDAVSNSHTARLYGASDKSQRELCALEVNYELSIIEEHNQAKAEAAQGLRNRRSTQEPPLEIEADYTVGDWIEFAAGKGSEIYLGNGWSSAAESWGRWSAETWGRWDEGSEADVILHPSSDASEHLEIEAIAFVTENNPLQTVGIVVNGEEIKTLSFTPSTVEQKHRIELPSDLPRGKRRIVIRFKIAKPRSPREVGHGTDDRKIGIGVLRLRLV